MTSLSRHAKGTLRASDGRVFVTFQRSANKPAKEHEVGKDVLRAEGLAVEELDGVAANVTWDLGDGNITLVEALFPEDRPVALHPNEASFLNPYGFISIPDRDDLPTPLRDGPMAGHDRYRPERWTGMIGVTIAARTPMLIPDHSRAAVAAADGGSSAALPVRVDHLGRPVLSGSAVKGALRAAYESITNSRFGIFPGHEKRLAIRATADEKVIARLRPAWVSGVADGNITLTMVDSLDPIGGVKESAWPVQTAVWVPRSLACRTARGCRSQSRCLRPDGRHCAEPRGKVVDAWLYLAMLGKFPLWRVAGYASAGKLGAPPPPHIIERGLSKGLKRADHPLVKVRGRLHWTGSTFPAGGNKKHDERLVVEEVLGDGQAELRKRTFVVSEELLDGWRAVIASYDHAHEHDKKRETDYGGYVTDPKRWQELAEDDTLYVGFDEAGNMIGLYPAMIGRKAFSGSPQLSLPEPHHPATARDRLSPADRVFGWVAQGANDEGVAHRGHLRVLPPDEDGTPGPGSIKQLDPPLPLVTLNSPKPAQFLFYLGDQAGRPRSGAAKDPAEGYAATPGERRLRGRKVYLTHAEVLDGVRGADEYWTPPRAGSGKATPIDVGGRQRYREYIRPQDDIAGAKEERNEVTTWVSSWVNAGTTFRITLHVDNLDATELGALLWLLTLPSGASLKLGLGKPLGFGAVRVDVDWETTRLFTGGHLLDRYRILGRESESVEPAAVGSLRDEYDRLLREHLPQVRAEFLNAARGFVGAPVHYPRAGNGEKSDSSAPKQAPDNDPHGPRLTTYDWWVANDRVGKFRPGRRLALGDLADPKTMPLPYQPSDPEIEEPTTGGSGGNGTSRPPGKGRPSHGKGGAPGGRNSGSR